MTSNKHKRLRTGFIISIIFHMMLFLVIGLLGFFSALPPADQSAEVSIMGEQEAGRNAEKSKKPQVQKDQKPQPKEEDTQNSELNTKQDALTTMEDEASQRKVPHYMQPKEEASPSDSNNDKGYGSDGGNSSASGQGSGSDNSGSNENGEDTGDGGNVAAVPPRVVSRTQPVYPRSASQQGSEGTVKMRLLVNTGGNVSEAVVAVSSGNVELDAAAIDAAEKWQFIPAQNGFGQDIDCYVNVEMTFNLYQ